MGDTRFQSPYRWVKDADDPANAIRELSDEEVIAALAAASRDQDPYLANVLATEALNRTVQKNAIMETAGEGMYAVNRLGCITYLNPAAERMLGCRLADVARHHVHEVLGVERPRAGTVSATEDPALAAMRTNATVHLEDSIIRRRDGTLFPAFATASPILRDGDVEGAVVVFSDVSERERAERARRETEGRLRAVLTAAPIMLFALDEDGIFTLVEGQASKLLGKAPDDALGRAIWETHSDHPPILACARRALAGESFTSVIERGNQTYENHWAPLRSGREPPTGALCVAVDVTARVMAEQAQRRSEERFRSLFEHHPDGIGSTDVNGRIVDVNPAFAGLLGWSRDEFKGRLFGELVAPEDIERVERVLGTFGTKASGIEFQMVTRDGGRVDVRGLAVPMLVEGEFVGFHGVVQDITARKRAERKLHENREQLERIVGSVPEGIVITDERGIIRFANAAAVRLLGRPSEAIVGMRLDDPAWDLASPEGLPLHPSELSIDRALSRGEPIKDRILTFRRSDGARPIVRANLVPTRGPGNVVVGAVVSFIDVTEATHAQMQLRQREEAYRALAENSPDFVMRIDHCLQIVYVNKALAQAAGLPARELMGVAVGELSVLGESAPLLERTLQQVLRLGKPAKLEHPLAGASEGCLVETRLVPEFAESGRVRYVLGISRDVTERKRDAEMLQRLNEELSRQSEERANQLHDIAHDLEAFAAVTRERVAPPLESAHALLRTLEESTADRLDSRTSEKLAEARRAHDHASRALARLLELRRVVAEELGAPRPVALSEVLEGATWRDRCATTLAERGARLEATSDEAPPFLAPPEALAGMLADLTLDLLEWADAREPTLAILCRPVAKPGWVEVRLEANGPGFPPEARALLQEPDDDATWTDVLVHRGAPAFRLALARRLARRLGGRLRLREPAEGGAAIDLLLPAAAP